MAWGHFYSVTFVRSIIYVKNLFFCTWHLFLPSFISPFSAVRHKYNALHFNFDVKYSDEGEIKTMNRK